MVCDKVILAFRKTQTRNDHLRQALHNKLYDADIGFITYNILLPLDGSRGTAGVHPNIFKCSMPKVPGRSTASDAFFAECFTGYKIYKILSSEETSRID